MTPEHPNPYSKLKKKDMPVMLSSQKEVVSSTRSCVVVGRVNISVDEWCFPRRGFLVYEAAR